ncbi:MAG: hypothetical protein HY329_08355 [Chloroflexi bacterium]|nr:hypothetical protein [Chloroflexota bacterium]
MTAEELHQLAEQRARARAVEDVHNRLALASAVIWVLVTIAITILVVSAYGRRPRAPIVLLMGFSTLIPAAIPWLLRNRLVAARTAHYLPAEIAALQSGRAYAP